MSYVHRHVRSFQGREQIDSNAKYATTSSGALRGIFKTFPAHFADPFPASSEGLQYALVCVQYLSGRLIYVPTMSATSNDVMFRISKKNIYLSGPLIVTIRNNASCFTAATVSTYMKECKIEWSTALAYVRTSNGHVQRTAGTVKKIVVRMVAGDNGQWFGALRRSGAQIPMSQQWISSISVWTHVCAAAEFWKGGKRWLGGTVQRWNNVE